MIYVISINGDITYQGHKRCVGGWLVKVFGLDGAGSGSGWVSLVRNVVNDIALLFEL